MIIVSEKSQQNISSFCLRKDLNLIKNVIISSKTSKICSCSDIYLTNMNYLPCNFCIYVYFDAANMLTWLIY